MGVVTLDGSISIGPASSGGNTFPSSTETVAIQTTPNPKQSSVATGTLVRNLSIPSPAWQVLSGVGANDTVTRCDFLYFRSNAPVQLRLTMEDPANPTGPAIVSIVPVQGLLVHEFPNPGCLKLLEFQGSATVEYMASGTM